MNARKKAASCAQAKQLDIVFYLSALGYEPAKIRNQDYWYLSPLREEKTPSFKVNRKLNRWYDHGLGKGGNLVDFAILYNNCTVKEFLQTLASIPSSHKPVYTPPANLTEHADNQIRIVAEKELTNSTLLRYLDHRRIPILIAKQFCREVTYEISSRIYYAIGFKNNSGGYEIRNAHFKGSSMPKDITTIVNHAEEVTVFEGFFDFLSFMAIVPIEGQISTDFTILNSVSLFEKARPFIEQYDVINLYLDRDRTGQNCSRHALSLSKKYKDRSSLYEHYKDVNEWVMHIGKSPDQSNNE